MKVRAYDKDGNVVVGWYFTIHDRHFISSSTSEAQSYDACNGTEMFDILAWLEIPDITTAAVATGRKDKNGVEIYGSMGEMQGGDRVELFGRRKYHYNVRWDERRMTWIIGHDGLCAYGSGEIEIIPPQGKEGK